MPENHIHIFNIKEGIPTSPDSGDPHTHTVVQEGKEYTTSSDTSGPDHTHTVEIDGKSYTSGRSLVEEGMGKALEQQIMEDEFEPVEKAVGLPESIDPGHEYVYRSGIYGIYVYWYKDMAGNYWKYTNAPEGHADHDQHAGEAMLAQDQPLPHLNAEFFTEEGKKRHMAVPMGMEVARNPQYNPKDPRNTWFELYKSEDGEARYIYLDADIKENLDLWVQQQLRVVDVGMLNYRQYANVLFNGQHPKDKITAAILMLVDQGLYDPEELADATVKDIQFIDQTVKLLGREFVCDIPFYDFLTSLVGDRSKPDPLFELDTVHGRNSIGYNYLYAVFQSLSVSPKFLLYWHASHMFSRILNRHALQQTPAKKVEKIAFKELSRALTAAEDVRYLVDVKLRDVLLENYEGSIVEKSLKRKKDEGYGVMQVFSDLTSRRGDEKQFSDWLHAEPLHDLSPAEQVAVDEYLQGKEEEEATEQQEEQTEGEQGAEQATPAPPEGGEAP